MIRTQKISKITEIKDIYYFIGVSIILSVIILFFLINNFKNYQSEVSVLVLLKSESSIAQAGQITENIAELPHNLSFFERIISSKKIEDPFAGYSRDQRKKLWNKKLSVERIGDSSIINIRVLSDSRLQSQKIAKQAVLVLSDSVSRYYNIKKDISLRIIDGPITSAVVSGWQWIVIISIFLGTSLAYLLGLLINNLERIIPKRKLQLSYDNYLSPEITDANTAEIKRTVSTIKKHQAPENLPIAPADYPEPELDTSAENQDDIIQEEGNYDQVTHKKSIPSQQGEPTDDELKERLNQLLRGGM